MKYNITVKTTFYKNAEVEADSLEDAYEAAYAWMDDNDVMHNASVETELTEVTL